MNYKLAKTFTKVLGKDARQLLIGCEISKNYDPSKDAAPERFAFEAMWDTGSQLCLISQSVINKCGLKPIGHSLNRTASDVEKTPVYNIAVFLPSGVCILSANATRLTRGPDVIIGMNIIRLGDLIITNRNGVTKFSFQFPGGE